RVEHSSGSDRFGSRAANIEVDSASIVGNVQDSVVRIDETGLRAVAVREQDGVLVGVPIHSNENARAGKGSMAANVVIGRGKAGGQSDGGSGDCGAGSDFFYLREPQFEHHPTPSDSGGLSNSAHSVKFRKASVSY